MISTIHEFKKGIQKTMSKKLFFYLFTALLVSSVLVSCRKDDDNNNGGNGNTTQDGFFYAENGGSQIKLDNPFVNGAYNTIIAQSGTTTVMEMNLSALTAGTYTMSGSNAFTYIKSGASSHWTATGGSVVITSNSGGKLTGTFDVQGSGITGINRISGAFTNIIIK